jgi:LDH2 family malate/lactate/ureidoglycolate dehydrogenase
MFMAMRSEIFVGAADYEARMNELVDRAKTCPRADGFDEIVMPGEAEQRLADQRRRDGLGLSASDIAMLRDEASAVGVSSLV